MPIEVECDNCGEVTKKKPCRVERSNHDFCSRECNNEFQSTVTGKNHPSYKERVEYNCKYCGDKNKTTPERAKESVYCNSECMSEHYKERFGGKNNPSWDGGFEEIECEWCGDTAEFTPAEAAVRRFCCARCYKDWLSDDRQGKAWVGEDNPAWQGGQERHRFYGPNWGAQRNAALERDGHECSICGDGEMLDVHHKVPMRQFNRERDDWYVEANDLKNLVTLCRSCHMTVHGNPKEHLFDYIG